MESGNRAQGSRDEKRASAESRDTASCATVMEVVLPQLDREWGRAMDSMHTKRRNALLEQLQYQ